MNFKTINRTIALAFSLVLMIFISSCTDDDVFRAGEDNEVKFSEYGLDWEVKGGLVGVKNIVNGFYDFAILGDATVGFTIAPAGDAVSSVDIMKSYNGSTPILHQTVTTFPADIVISLAEAVTGLTTLEEVELGDNIVYSLANLQTSSGEYPVGASVTADIKCSSSFVGTFDAVSTPMGVWGGSDPCPNIWEGKIVGEIKSDGIYLYSVDDDHEAGGSPDYSLGTYYACYGPTAALPEGDLRLIDFCNELSFTGLSQWSETYTIVNVVSEGDKLTFAWSNDYGEAGSTVLTRTDGNDWPTYSF